MPIQVTCQCGQRFFAKDDLLGKVIKCPKCGVALTIRPTPAAATAAHPDAEFPWPDDFGGAGTKAVPGKPARLPAAADPRGWIVLDTGLAICYGSLLVGGGAFAIIAVALLAMMTDPDVLPKLMTGGGGLFGILLLWSGLVWMGSYVSLLTGWRVGWAVPRATKTRHIIQAALGCVGASIGLIMLMQLLGLAMAPAIPSQPHNMADMRKFQADVQRAAKDSAANEKIMNVVDKVFGWLAMVALLASYAAFALFLGWLGDYLGAAHLKPPAIYFCVLQGAYAAWLTLLDLSLALDWFAGSPTLVRVCLILTIAFMLATYGGLIYLAYNTRRLVAKQA